MSRFAWGLADLVAAVWIWAQLVAAAVVYSVALVVLAYRKGRFARGRAEVLTAMERASSETVVLPKREQVKR
jgi:hypothetical protein